MLKHQSIQKLGWLDMAKKDHVVFQQIAKGVSAAGHVMPLAADNVSLLINTYLEEHRDVLS